ncbi:MAG: glucan biosynthesis protein, partial [Pseudomonadota bacterium]
MSGSTEAKRPLAATHALMVAGLCSLTAFAQVAAPDGSVAADPLQLVIAKARDLAAAPYVPPSGEPPAALAALTYDQYRDIRFRPEHALWRDQGVPFELMFFHLGKYQLQPVRVNTIDANGVARRIVFDSAEFDYGNNTFDESLLQAGLGFAGFRAHYALNSADYRDELIVFLGAS